MANRAKEQSISRKAREAIMVAVGGNTLNTDPLLQSGALVYRREKNGEILVLLVSEKRSKNWSIPKGNVKPHLTFRETAAKEAFEEAGVKGRISPNSVGMFRTKKRVSNRLNARVIEVWIFLLEATERRKRWPEKGKRQTKWVPCRTAAAQLREPMLANLCRRLARSS